MSSGNKKSLTTRNHFPLFLFFNRMLPLVIIWHAFLVCVHKCMYKVLQNLCIYVKHQNQLQVRDTEIKTKIQQYSNGTF